MKRQSEIKWRDFEDRVFRIILIILLAIGGMKVIIPEVKDLIMKIESHGKAEVK